MIRVLVNLTWLVPGVVGGSEEATTAALRALAEADDPGLDVHLAVLAPFPGAHPDLVDRFPTVVLDQSGSDKARRVLADQTWLPALARRLSADVVHHAGGVVPLRHPGRTVLTVHDLQPLDLPANFSRTKRTYLRLMSRRSFRAADVIVVPSRFTADRVRAHGAPADTPVRVVPWSLGAPTAPDRSSDRPSGRSSEVSGALRGHPYFLYPAITYPHKGHLLLLDAFAQVAADHPDTRLVLTGRPGPLEGTVAARADRPDLRGRVLRTGRIPAAELDRLRSAAVAVVVPSEYEGFGLPALEAVRDGTRVLVASAGSLPEVVPSTDVVPAADVRSWIRAMAEVLDESPEERRDRVDRARAHAAACTPGATAAGLAAAYREAAGRGVAR